MKYLLGLIIFTYSFISLNAFDPEYTHSFGINTSLVSNNHKTKIYLDGLAAGGKDINSTDGTGYNINVMYQYRRTENVKFGISLGFGQINSTMGVNNFSKWDEKDTFELGIETELFVINTRIFIEYNIWDNFNLSIGFNNTNILSSSNLDFKNKSKGEKVELEDDYFYSPEYLRNQSIPNQVPFDLKLIDNSLLSWDLSISYDFNIRLKESLLIISPMITGKTYSTDLIQKGDWSINSISTGIQFKLNF